MAVLLHMVTEPMRLGENSYAAWTEQLVLKLEETYLNDSDY